MGTTSWPRGHCRQVPPGTVSNEKGKREHSVDMPRHRWPIAVADAMTLHSPGFNVSAIIEHGRTGIFCVVEVVICARLTRLIGTHPPPRSIGTLTSRSTLGGSLLKECQRIGARRASSAASKTYRSKFYTEIVRLPGTWPCLCRQGSQPTEPSVL